MSTWLRLTLVTLSVGGGFAGLAAIVDAMCGPAAQGVATAAIFVGFLSVFLFVLIAGLLLVQNPRRVTPMIVALALQVPIISSPVIAYRLISGLNVSAAVSEGNLVFSYRFGSFAQFNYLQQLPFALGVNFVPLALLIATVITTPRRRRESVAIPEPPSTAE